MNHNNSSNIIWHFPYLGIDQKNYYCYYLLAVFTYPVTTCFGVPLPKFSITIV